MDQFYYTYNKPNKNINLKQYIYKIGSYHYNWHKDLELLLVLNGEVEVCMNGVTRILEANDMIIINSNIGHATLAQRPDSIAMVLRIDPIFLTDYYENTEFLSFDCCSNSKNRNDKEFVLIRGYLSDMILSFDKKNPEQQLLFESSLYSLFHTIVLHFPPHVIQTATLTVNQKKLDAVDKMIKYISKNYRKKITLDRLGKESGYNPNYISQLFKSHLGINFYDYLTRIRLREATLELGSSDRKISEIALSHGFSDIKAFNSAFKESFGKSPTAYRKQLNDDHIKNDIIFKRQFVSKEDEGINNKLLQYIENKNSFLSGNLQNKDSYNHEKSIQLIEILKEMSCKYKGLSKDLEQANDYLMKVIRHLSE